MQVLVVGATGLLGSNVVAEALDRGHDVVGTYHTTTPEFDAELRQTDIRETHEIESLFEEYDPDLVVNCAAMTDVDGCENNPETAHEVNGEAPGEIATASERHNAEFVHISTDYVFDGRRRTPYAETAVTNPLQEYGKSKVLGERRVLDANPESSILRLSFVYGVHRMTDQLSGFPGWVQEQLEAGNETPLFTDQFVTPSRAGHVADVVFDLYTTDTTGLLHVGSRNCVTPLDFGIEIASQLDLEPTFVEGSTDDMARDAVRPTYTCLDTKRIEKIRGQRQPTLAADLSALLSER